MMRSRVRNVFGCVARRQGAFTIFAVVDALTRISGKLADAGERSAVDQKASALLSPAK